MRHQEIHSDTQFKADTNQAIIDSDKIPSTVMQRLVEEVRTEKMMPSPAYNRTHNRHNRGR